TRMKANRPSGGYGRLRSAVEQAGSDQSVERAGRALTARGVSLIKERSAVKTGPERLRFPVPARSPRPCQQESRGAHNQLGADCDMIGTPTPKRRGRVTSLSPKMRS